MVSFLDRFTPLLACLPAHSPTSTHAWLHARLSVCMRATQLRDLLTRHKSLVARFLTEHYERFFGAYMTLVRSQQYVTKRQWLKLLSELLLDRVNFAVMTG